MAALLLISCLVTEPMRAYTGGAPALFSHNIRSPKNSTCYQTQALAWPILFGSLHSFSGLAKAHQTAWAASLLLPKWSADGQNLSHARRVATRVLLIDGPSGVGKSTNIYRFLRAHPNEFEWLPEVVVRPLRPNESPEAVRRLISRGEYDRKVSEGEILIPHNNHGLRGVLREDYERVLKSNKVIIVESQSILEHFRSKRADLNFRRLVLLPQTISGPLGLAEREEFLRVLRDRMIQRDPNISPEELASRNQKDAGDIHLRAALAYQVIVNPEGADMEAVYRRFEFYALHAFSSEAVPIAAGHPSPSALDARILYFLKQHSNHGYTPLAIAELLALDVSRKTMSGILDHLVEMKQLYRRRLRQKGGQDLYSAEPSPDNAGTSVTDKFSLASFIDTAIRVVMKSYGKPMSYRLILFLLNVWRRPVTRKVYRQLEGLIEQGHVIQLGTSLNRRYYLAPAKANTLRSAA